MIPALVQKMSRHKSKVVLLSLILTLGIFFRSYHFSDWLHFEIDQSYDTLLVSPAVENGPGNLPLLGPTAGGGRSLRLGPAFYYMEFLSASIFGNTPAGHAAFVLLLSILSLPLFFLLIKRYFSSEISILLLSLYASSLYLILYSRFSWSPNVLPMLLILSFYFLLRSVGKGEKGQDMWFLLAVFSIAIITQIHFNAFFIIPATTILFLAVKRPRYKARTWALALGIFLAVYSPVIISDIQMHGQNLGYFIEKINGDSLEKSNFPEKLMQIVHYHASDYFLIVSGLDYVNGSKLKGYGFQSRSAFPWRVSAIILLIGEILILVRKFLREPAGTRKDFLLLMTIWFFISFAYYFSVIKSGLNIYPRFFLLMAPLPIILLGLLLEWLLQLRRLDLRILTYGIFMALLCSNLVGLKKYYSQLANTQTSPLSIETEDVFPNTARSTLSQQKNIARYIATSSSATGYPTYLTTIHEFESILWYHLKNMGVAFHQNIGDGPLYAQANYYLVTFPKKNLDEYLERFDIQEKQSFGSLIAYKLSPKKRQPLLEKQEAPDEITVQQKQIQQIVTWNKLLKN